MSDDKDMPRISISFYTGEYAGMLEEALRSNGCWFRTVDRMTWEDGYEAARHDAGLDSARVYKGAGVPDEQRMATTWAEYLNTQVHGTLPRAMEDDYTRVETSPLDMCSTMFFIWAARDRLMKAADSYARMLRETEVGGDDDTFDYFPDAIEALYQLCYALGDDAKTIYEQTIVHAWNSKYRDIGDYESIEQQFPKWGA